jgi:hypothetical protein
MGRVLRVFFYIIGGYSKDIDSCFFDFVEVVREMFQEMDDKWAVITNECYQIAICMLITSKMYFFVGQYIWK